MRIALINWTNRHVGGAETYLARLIPQLLQAGHLLFFWHEGIEPSDRDVIAGSATLPASCVQQMGADAALRTLREWRPDVLYMHGVTKPELERRLLVIAPAVLLAHNYYGTCVSGGKAYQNPSSRPCSRRFGLSCLALYYPRRCGGLSPVTMMRDYQRQSQRRTLLSQYESIVTLSGHMRDEYIRHGVAPDSVHCLPSLQESDEAQIVATKSLPASGDVACRLAFIGRMDHLKGCSVLLAALPIVSAALGRVVLTIAGDGAEMTECVRVADRLRKDSNIDVAFLGWVGKSVRRDLLATTHVLVMPSLWPEPHGLVGLEALLQGVPVTAFAVGGIPEWLEDGVTGTLAPADPPTASGLAAAIIRCVSTPAIRRTLESLGQRPPSSSIADHVAAISGVLHRASVSSRAF